MVKAFVLLLNCKKFLTSVATTEAVEQFLIDLIAWS